MASVAKPSNVKSGSTARVQPTPTRRISRDVMKSCVRSVAV
jgi:hypothetical protein